MPKKSVIGTVASWLEGEEDWSKLPQQAKEQKLEDCLQKLKNNERLSVYELRFLQDSPTLQKLMELDGNYFEQKYGKTATAANIRQELADQLKKLEELLYMKKIEAALLPRIRRDIVLVSERIRQKAQNALTPEVQLEERINTVLLSKESEIASGEKFFDTPQVEEYIKRIKIGVAEQAKGIDKEKPKTEDQLFEIYDHAGQVVRFVANHLPDPTSTSGKAKVDLITADLTKKIREGREKGDLSLLQEIYTTIQKSFGGDAGPNQVQQKMEAYQKQLLDSAMKDRKKLYLDMFHTHLGRVDMTEREIAEMLTHGSTLTGGASYESKLAFACSEIESTLFWKDQAGALPEKEKKMEVEKKENQMKNILGDLSDVVKEFRSRVTFEKNHIIDGLPDAVANTLDRALLKKATDFMKRIRSVKDVDIIFALGKIERREISVDEFLKAQQKDAEQYLLMNSISKFTPETLKKHNSNARDFQIFDLALEQIEYGNVLAARDQKQMNDDPDFDKKDDFVNGKELKDITNHLRAMESIMERKRNRNFSVLSDEKDFIEAVKEIEYLKKKPFFVYEEELDQSGRPIIDPTTGKPKTIRMERVRKMPLHEQKVFEDLQIEKKNYDEFVRTFVALENMSGSDFEKVPLIQRALEALYTDIDKLHDAKNQIETLSRVMSLPHELTMIRFHPRTKLPFEHKDQYQFLDVNGQPFVASGEPATFQQRSVALLKAAQDALRQRNFSELRRLFARGMRADRLYMDSLFFPVGNITEAEKFLYDLDYNAEETVQNMTFTPKVREGLRHYFSKYPEKIAGNITCQTFLEDHQQKTNRLLQGQHLEKIGRLADDDAFCQALVKGGGGRDLTLEEYASKVTFTDDGRMVLPDGTPVSDQAMEAELLKLREGLGRDGVTLAAHGESGGKFPISADRISAIAKDYPLIATRVAQFNNEFLGWTVGGGQMLARMGTNDVKAGVKAPFVALGDYMRSITLLSPQHIWIGIWQIIEHVEKMVDETTKYSSYLWLEHTFEGTILGSEFKKLAESQEHHRVDEFKAAMHHYGNEAVLHKLTHARDRFEFKAALTEGFEERGIITMEDLLTQDFLKALNGWHLNGFKIPIKYKDEDMQDVRDTKLEVLRAIEDSIDDMWGKGQFQRWKSAGDSKYESVKKQHYDSMSTFSAPEKEKIYQVWWDQLKTEHGRKELKKKHPGEIVGIIEQDMMEGKQDSGITFGIMQAMICAGIVKLQYVIQLQYHHANDLPIHALLEPKQAELCGLKDFFEQCMKDGEELKGGGKWHDFHAGARAIPVRAKTDSGKWKFAKSQEELNGWDKKGELEQTFVTIHQFQRARQAQEKDYKGMDNSSIGLFLPGYNFPEILKAYHRDSSGNIQGVRAHDTVAAYRGFHHVFASYMEVLGDTSKFPTDCFGETTEKKVQSFLRSVYFAYDAMAKTAGFAMMLNCYKGKSTTALGDFKHGTFDASPNLGFINDQDYRGNGKTMYEELILTNQGGFQRMQESQKQMDGMSDDVLSPQLRRDFKLMAGYQYIWGGGVNRSTGKKEGGNKEIFIWDGKYDPARTERNPYDPARAFVQTAKSFYDCVLKLAAKRGIEREIRTSLDKSLINKFGIEKDYDPSTWNPNDSVRLGRLRKASEDRQEKLQKWYDDDVKI